jgi:hypothetical protein
MTSNETKAEDLPGRPCAVAQPVSLWRRVPAPYDRGRAGTDARTAGRWEALATAPDRRSAASRDTRSRRYRNPRYAPESLERKLSPSSYAIDLPPVIYAPLTGDGGTLTFTPMVGGDGSSGPVIPTDPGTDAPTLPVPIGGPELPA